MGELRRYGKQPFGVVVVHGGPGACGEMRPVAEQLEGDWGVLEPIQNADSLEGQVEELKTALENHGNSPITLIGFSWGAWLSLIVASRFPAIVKKLILVGSGPFEQKYAEKIEDIRLSRLNDKEKVEFESIARFLNDSASEDKSRTLARLGELALKTDTYEAIEDKVEKIDFRVDIFQSVWSEAAKMRRSGELLRLAQNIHCPVVAIHGDYDPHPWQGVKKLLSCNVKNFRFILLKNCGHKPWIERRAREEFYAILQNELI